MAYRISQPLAATPLPGDGKKKKRIKDKSEVFKEAYGGVKAGYKKGKSSEVFKEAYGGVKSGLKAGYKKGKKKTKN